MKLALLVLALSACAHHTSAPAAPAPVAQAESSKLDQLVATCERDDDPAACYAAAYVFDQGLADQRVDHERADRFGQRAVAATVYACKNRNDASSCRLTAAHIKLALTRVKDDDTRRHHLVEYFVTVAAAGCYAGDLDLCLDAAAVLVRGETGTVDRDYARVLTEHACESDNQEACVALAIMLDHDGTSSAEDQQHAIALFERACTEHARGDGCASLATIALRASRNDDARRLSARACDLGAADGCALLGHCLLDGLGGPSDRPAAIVAFRKACKAGDDRGCQMLTALGQPR